VARVEQVNGGPGVRLAVRSAGPADGPAVLLLHGWAQSKAVWQRYTDATDSPLSRRYQFFAADLRGHGESDVPADGYDDPAAWAADVHGLLTHIGRPAVLVGWSYGGLVVTDYVREFGSSAVAGIMYVGAITEIGRARPAMRAALPDALSADPAVAEPALRSFAVGMAAPGRTVRPTPLAQGLLDAALRVPAPVRAALFRRDVDSAEVLAGIDVPTLVLHGRADAVVDPSVAEYTAKQVPGAELRWLDGVGHLPFLERPAEFDHALHDLVERTESR
jgi:non-heme chloroperoxidase